MVNATYEKNEGKARQNSHTHNRTLTETNEQDVVATVLEYILKQQYIFNRGLKIFRKKGKNATTKELRQSHNMDALIPLDASSLSDEERKMVIALLMFLTQKWDGLIQAWQCANGHKQYEYMEKDESALPTVLIKAIFLTITIEATDRREVAVVDLLGAFFKCYE